MKIRFWSGLCLAALLSLLQVTPSANASPTLERIKKRNALVLAVSESYPPFSFLNDKNQMDGFDIEVAREVAKRLGVPLKVETPSWEVLVAGSWRGRWDICICSMTPDKQRAQVLDFVAPYYNSPAVLVTSADSAAKTVRDFNGKRIGVEQSSSYERYLKRELIIEAPDAKPLVFAFDNTVRVAPYGNEDLAFQDLALGGGKRVDAVLSNYVTAKTRMDKSPGKFKLVGEPVYSEPNWVAVDKSGDAEWKTQIQKIVRELKADGTLARLSKKWLGRDISA